MLPEGEPIPELARDLAGRRFRFGRVDGVQLGILALNPNGTLAGYQNANEHAWSVEDGRLVFRSIAGAVTTVFDEARRDGSTFVFRGRFVPRGPEPWHTLTEIPRARVIPELIATLYGDHGPLAHADAGYRDAGYPHTNLRTDIIESLLDVAQPSFWLEVGSMLGGSAIRVADAVRQRRAATEIVCIDPFCGDVNMWAWEQPRGQAGEWRFLRLERGRPTIFDRFLANVAAAGHADVILPITATATVGAKLLRRLFREGRISSLPAVIYLDSAHEPDETFLELQACWSLLERGGILCGDDWAWPSVRNDVLRFAKALPPAADRRQSLAKRHRRFTEEGPILLDRGLWAMVK